MKFNFRNREYRQTRSAESILTGEVRNETSSRNLNSRGFHRAPACYPAYLILLACSRNGENNFRKGRFSGCSERGEIQLVQVEGGLRSGFPDFHFKEWITRHMAVSWNIDELISFEDWPYALIFNLFPWLALETRGKQPSFSSDKIILASNMLLNSREKWGWTDRWKLGRRI